MLFKKPLTHPIPSSAQSTFGKGTESVDLRTWALELRDQGLLIQELWTRNLII